MATKKKVVVRTALDIAIMLEDVRAEKKTNDALEKALTTELKTAMKNENLNEIANYQLSVARTLKVEDEHLARLWAVENRCMKPEVIDTSKAKEILRHTFDDPSKYGFAIVESERIVPKGSPEE